jgi:hypothetical protein
MQLDADPHQLDDASQDLTMYVMMQLDAGTGGHGERRKEKGEGYTAGMKHPSWMGVSRVQKWCSWMQGIFLGGSEGAR